MGITPRPYQEEALEALDQHIMEKETHPCVVIPTGGGKSILMAWAIQQWVESYPAFRVCILAHRKELVFQNSAEMEGVINFFDHKYDIGVYSAGLRRRDIDSAILFASIDSIYNKWGEFPPFDCIIVDEAHRIPIRGEGKYRSFIEGCTRLNPNLKVVGFTATPFRMGVGNICHKDHILNEICYEANVAQLIRDGYLCPLRSKVGEYQPDLSDVKRNSGGDYICSSLAKAVEIPELVDKAVADMVGHIQRENRKSVIVFCVDIQHCKEVSAAFFRHGIEAVPVTGKTSAQERDRVVEAFKEGKIRVIVNCNVYTEGFNAKRVDCIALLRPTLSKSLFVQMVGRGFRLHPEKDNCLVLDYAHCIQEHGPIDEISAGAVRMATCGDCGDTFSHARRICPNCKWEIPKQEVERVEAEERERARHAEEASRLSILGKEPVDFPIDEVKFFRHKKTGKPDSVRVEYRSGTVVLREWVCLEHGGYAEQKARKWWAQRFGSDSAKTITVEEALNDFFLEKQVEAVTQEIKAVKEGKYYSILSHKLLPF